MSHSQMLKTRRRRQKAKKRLAALTKQAKRLRGQNTKKAGTPVPKKVSR